MILYNDEPLGVEIELAQDDSFLLIKETLTRIGIGSDRNKTLWQSCHILHKRGKYYIMHFKEMFLLDGKEANITLEDKTRRYAIVKMLSEWNMCKPVKELPEIGKYPRINIIRHGEKSDWNLVSKYSIGMVQQEF